MSTGVAAAADGEDRLRKELQELQRRSIFFGHQSVGWNLMDGVKQLATEERVALQIVKAEHGGDVPRGTFAHGEVGENGNPALKLKSFGRALEPGIGPDIALIKFCYADIDASTDVRKLFAEYTTAISALKVKHPRTTFVHVTTPLTTVQGGAKAFAKRLLGKVPNGLRENARREEFNALLRETTAGKEPLFDLALAESTAPDGSREAYEWDGRSIPALVPAYTGDGGHLNAAGRERAARQLISVLASVPIDATPSAQR